ncbi:MAG: cyclic nucleotide-binding domain-containing protein [Chloroflexi bacterium]|nr:cyclic nucleotide-binding domain-containing protein [Chloroflexota bacterium]
MTQEIYTLLKQSEWFSNLPDEVIHLLMERVKTHTVQPGEAIIQRGQQDDSVFMIQSGWVKVVIPEEGEEGEMVLNHVGPGEMVGELSLVDQRPRSASVIALSELSVLELTRRDFLEIMEQYPMMGLHMLITTSKRMRFVLTYLEQAVTWSHKIAEGDYSFLEEEQAAGGPGSVVDHSASDSARANRFLAAFFQMAQDVQKREAELKEQVKKLIIQIDSGKRDHEIEQIVGSDFFAKLKLETLQIREERDKSKKA